MRALILAVALATGVSSAASAEVRLSDSDYITLSRCSGLVTATGGDVAASNAAIVEARRNRPAHIRERAADARREAMRQVNRADANQRAALISERDTQCAAFQARAVGTSA